MATIAERFAQFKRLIVQAIVTPVLILFLLVGLLSWQVAQLVSAVRWVDHSDQVIAQANLAFQIALRSETSLRGYLISGESRDLQPYREAQKTIGPTFAALRGLVSDNPPQVAQAQRMDSEYDAWVADANQEIRSRNKGLASEQEAYARARALFPMDIVHDDYLRFIAAEDRLRRIRTANVAHTTAGVVASGLFLTIAAGLILGLLSVRSLGMVSQEYEHALAAEQEIGQMLATTLLSIGDAVLVTDEAGRITQMNAAAERLTGWMGGDAIGRSAKEVFKIAQETTRKPVESPIDRVIREGVVVGIANHTILIRRDGTEVPIDDSGAPIKSDDGKLIGVVLVFRDVTERRLAERTLAEAFEREHRIAETLQESLLIKPSREVLSGLEAETYYRPAQQEAKVGGDYYDLFPLGEGTIALVVGDISGKGLAAAARITELKYTLRSYMREHPHPATGLARLNSFICESHALEGTIQPYFLVLTVVVIDSVRCQAQIGAGGAEPPILLRADGEVELAQVAGMPLGIDPKAIYNAITVDLRPNDILMIATDGVTEARNGQDFLGVDGLARMAQECADKKALAAIGTCVLDRAREFAEDEFSDDVCMLLARVK